MGIRAVGRLARWRPGRGATIRLKPGGSIGDRQPLSINIRAIGVAGIGGLGMIALVVIIDIAFPIARWVLLSGILGGGLSAMALIGRRLSRRSEERRVGKACRSEWALHMR